jgi:hypothetical protein
MGRAVIVRLTTRQWDAVFTRLQQGWLLDWVYNEARIEEVGKKVEVLMLPDAWRAVADELIATWFTTGSIRKASAPLFDGVRNIVKETNRRQAHPAFRSEAVAGVQRLVFPAWGPLEGPDARTQWSPWILSDTKLHWLWPQARRVGGVTVTEWHQAPIQAEVADAYERFIKARPAAAGSPSA